MKHRGRAVRPANDGDEGMGHSAYRARGEGVGRVMPPPGGKSRPTHRSGGKTRPTDPRGPAWRREPDPSMPSLSGLGAATPRAPLLRTVLVELDAPLALVGLLQAELRAEGAAGAGAEAGHRLLRAPDPGLLARLARGAQRFDQLLRDGHRQALPRLPLPDHEPAAGVVARPARVALPVLRYLAPADR